MDLVGIDVGIAVAQSFTALSFGEPRWRPSPLQARMVDAGRLGRKTGRGWYEYGADGACRADDPIPDAPGGGDGPPVAILGAGPLAEQLRARASAAGYAVGETGELVVDASVRPARGPADAKTRVVLCAASSLAARGDPHAVGFHLLPPLDDCRLVELTRLPGTPASAVRAAERFFTSLGLLGEWVGDAPGLVLGRVVCQLVNEAAFAIGEGVGSADDVDLGTTLGLAHPRGPIAWSEAIGIEHVHAVLDGLWEERREERYRPAPLLHRAALLKRPLRDA
jgi:3-hydroxybutyryl-CoA dehydrogenase